MAWLMPFSVASWNWLFSAAISCTSYLEHKKEQAVPAASA